MFVIDSTLISDDLIERHFVCDLAVCKGQCCIDGDAGAPLLEEEKIAIEENLDKILPLLTPGGRKAVEEEGVAYLDKDEDLVTTLIEGQNCAFTTFTEDGTCLCALEKGYREGLLPDLKPSSCSLYPVRLSKLGNMTALNLHRWKICSCAEKNGRRLKIPAYIFLKNSLIKKFGQAWFDQLDLTAKEWLKYRGDKTQ
ncbi:MAG: DUF3109 family protein [Muribaculaceae bacterium]|nr:DUF3109 family protein [Muribaculaceae bacterium]